MPENTATNAYLVWTFPVAFENIVFGVFYTSGIHGAWNHSNYMHHNCCDYITKTSVNLFAHTLGKNHTVVQGFAVVYGF